MHFTCIRAGNRIPPLILSYISVTRFLTRASLYTYTLASLTVHPLLSRQTSHPRARARVTLYLTLHRPRFLHLVKSKRLLVFFHARETISRGSRIFHTSIAPIVSSFLMTKRRSFSKAVSLHERFIAARTVLSQSADDHPNSDRCQ